MAEYAEQEAQSGQGDEKWRKGQAGFYNQSNGKIIAIVAYDDEGHGWAKTCSSHFDAIEWIDRMRRELGFGEGERPEDRSKSE